MKLQIADFALHRLKYFFQIENFASDNGTRDVIMGWGRGKLKLPYFEEGVCDQNTFLVSEGRKSTFFNHQGLFIGEPYIQMMYLYILITFIIETKYILFTLLILNKIIGNVHDSRTETIDMRLRQRISLQIAYKFPSKRKFRFR